MSVLYSVFLLLALHCATARRTTTETSVDPLAIQEPSDPLNRYCNYSVWDASNPQPYRLIDIKCANDPTTELKEESMPLSMPVTYFQADNGAMSRAVEDAIHQMKRKFPDPLVRQIRVKVNGFHPHSSRRFYGRLLAMIDVSNKLAEGLHGDDYVHLTVEDVGLRVDSRFDSERVKVLPVKDVVLVPWNYKKNARTPGRTGQ